MTHVCPGSDRADPNPEEALARELLQRFVDGEIVSWDDNSEALMWDFCIVEDGTHRAALEVTVSTNQNLMRFQNQLERAGGSSWPAPAGTLGVGWLVDLAHETDVRRFDREALFRLLRAAEADEVDHLFWAAPGELNVQAKSLGISSAITRLHGNPDEVIVTFKSPTWVGDEFVTESLTRHAAKNAGKLQRAPAPRHLFVWMDFYDFPAAFEMRELPTETPVPLPDFVDVAWVGCRAFSVEQPALWVAGHDEPWKVLQASGH